MEAPPVYFFRLCIPFYFSFYNQFLLFYGKLSSVSFFPEQLTLAHHLHPKLRKVCNERILDLPRKIEMASLWVSECMRLVTHCYRNVFDKIAFDVYKYTHGQPDTYQNT